MLRQVLLFCLLIAVTEVRSTIVAQLSGSLNTDSLYGSWHQEITDFNVDREVGLEHQNGRLNVKTSGYYYIYAQAWFEEYPGSHHNRVAIAVNGNTVSLLQTTRRGTGYGSVFSGVTKWLTSDDYISMKTVYPSKLWMEEAHTFFGAYKI